jgi:TPR repeat protein
MFDLGDLYEKGAGVPRNAVIARQWYEKAASFGDENAKGALKRLDSPAVQPSSAEAGQKRPSAN